MSNGRRVLFAPHADDETLFAFYAVLRFQPGIVICFPSERDYGDTKVRTAESAAAMRLAGVDDVEQYHCRSEADVLNLMRAVAETRQPSEVWAPSADASHEHHVMVGKAAVEVFGDRVRQYHTYDGAGKVRRGAAVPVEPGWPDLKRQALACYRTQIEHPRARVFYDEQRFELDEYVPAAAAVDQPPVPEGTPTLVPEAAAPTSAPDPSTAPLSKSATKRLAKQQKKGGKAPT